MKRLILTAILVLALTAAASANTLTDAVVKVATAAADVGVALAPSEQPMDQVVALFKASQSDTSMTCTYHAEINRHIALRILTLDLINPEVLEGKTTVTLTAQQAADFKAAQGTVVNAVSDSPWLAGIFCRKIASYRSTCAGDLGVLDTVIDNDLLTASYR